MGLLEGLRKDRLVRPADPDRPVYDSWRDDPPDSAWVRSPAIISANSEKTRRDNKTLHKPKVAETCNHEGCNEKVYQAGLCKVHRLEVIRDRNRVYRAKRRDREMEARLEQGRKSGRPCEVCGAPVPLRYKRMLCRTHIREANARETSQ